MSGKCWVKEESSQKNFRQQKTSKNLSGESSRNKRNWKNLQKSYRSNEIAIRLGICIIFLTSGWLRKGLKMYLFVRKNKDDKESKEFYYLGRIHHEPDGLLEEFVMPNTDVSAVEIEYKLKTPVEKNLYDYLTSENV